MSETASPVPGSAGASGAGASGGRGSTLGVPPAIGTPTLHGATPPLQQQQQQQQQAPSATLASASHRHPYSAASLSALEVYKKRDPSKIVIRFKAIGSAPQMKNNYFRITSFNRFQAVIQFLRKEIGIKPSDALFTYINSSFSPAPDDSVGNLFRCFGTEGHLIVNYSLQAAWG